MVTPTGRDKRHNDHEMARPRKDFDKQIIRRMAELGAPQAEIAQAIGCSVDTLHRRFADVLKKGGAQLNISLRRLQVRSAKKGNVTMLIWLGKQRLGQRNQPTTTDQDDQLETIIRQQRAYYAALVSKRGDHGNDT